MLREFPSVRQEPSGHRRLFCDENHDLYAWYDVPDGRLLGFQLTYFEGDDMKAFTWTQDNGYAHNLVDGWDSHRFNITPLLVADGLFAPNQVLAWLVPLMGEVDTAVRELVLEKVREFPG